MCLHDEELPAVDRPLDVHGPPVELLALDIEPGEIGGLIRGDELACSGTCNTFCWSCCGADGLEVSWGANQPG